MSLHPLNVLYGMSMRSSLSLLIYNVIDPNFFQSCKWRLSACESTHVIGTVELDEARLPHQNTVSMVYSVCSLFIACHGLKQKKSTLSECCRWWVILQWFSLVANAVLGKNIWGALPPKFPPPLFPTPFPSLPPSPLNFPSHPCPPSPPFPFPFCWSLSSPPSPPFLPLPSFPLEVAPLKSS